MTTPALDSLRGRLTDYANDINLNLANVLSVEGAPDLTPIQIAVTALACAYVTKNADIIAAVTAHGASIGLEETGVRGARAAATIMAMNNVYYRFTHMVADEEIRKMPAGLRMNVMAKPGIPHVDFELASLGVSAINNCEFCVKSHAKKVIEQGVSARGVQSVARIAAVIYATAQALAIEA